MKQFLVGILILASTALYLSITEKNTPFLQQLENDSIYQEYIDWQILHGKTYNKASQEDSYRFKVWLENKAYVDSGVSKTAGMNTMADLTLDEFAQLYLNFNKDIKKVRNQYQQEDKIVEFQSNPDIELPTSVDWIKKGGVTPAQNQGTCNADYAFATSGALEGLYFVTTDNLVPLSTQQIVDCAWDFSYGCSGGYISTALIYVINNGIMTEASYPYTLQSASLRGDCDYKEEDVVFKNNKIKALPERDVKAMMEGLTVQPQGKDIDGYGQPFQLYSGGIFDDPDCGAVMSHSLLLVGYDDVSAETPYWTLKNDWGQGWGEKGFMKIYKDLDGFGDGVCGVNIFTEAPVIVNE